MKKISLALILAGSLFASEYSYEISPMIGGVKPEGNLNIDDDDQFVYGVRFQMNDYNLLGFVPELSFDRSTDTDHESPTGDTAINRLSFNGLYEFKEISETVSPYFLIGLGYEDVEDEPAHAYDSSAYGNWGGGIKWKVMDDIALRAEVKHLIRTDDGGNELYYGIGLTIPFGEKASNNTAENSNETAEEPKEEVAVAAAAIVVVDSDNDGVADDKDKCPTTPEGVAVDENGCCLDSDGDGVADYKDKCPNTPKGVAVDENGCCLDSDGDGIADYKDKCPNTVAGAKVDVNGCAATVVLDIHFENASAKINTQHSPKLEKYISFMNDNENYDVTIIGYTDSRGAESFNQDLSQKRADSVKKALVDGGVKSTRITAVGKGEANPIADNATSEGRAQNRRIEAELKLQD